MKEFFRKILRKLTLFALGEYADEVLRLKESRSTLTELSQSVQHLQDKSHWLEEQVNGQAQTIQYIIETLMEKSHSIDVLQSTAEGHGQSIQYLTETLMEKSYSIDVLKKASEGYAQSVQYLTETLMDKSYSIDVLQKASDGYAQSVQYLTETLMEKSHSIDVLQEANQESAQKIGYLTETLMEKSYWIDALLKDSKRLKTDLKKMAIRLREMPVQSESNPARVYQVVPNFKPGDAIGNHALFIDKVLKDRNIPTGIYAQENLTDRTDIRSLEELGPTTEKDVIILHMAAENSFADVFDAYAAKKVLLYHNITPAHFFQGFDEFAEKSTSNGRKQTEGLRDVADACIADSAFNKQELEQMGYTAPIHVASLPFAKEDYAGVESAAIKEKICDGKKNILFVGRVAPNKKFEDLIAAYQHYRDYYDANTRLILVGSFREQDKYYQFLQEKLRPQDDVLFTGHIPAEEWITYYRYAHLFLCMSEHEGFCVPIIEAMSHGIPVVAYDSSAVGDTLGGGGLLLQDKSPENTAKAMHDMLTDAVLCESLSKKQEESMNRFRPEVIAGRLFDVINSIMEGRE